MTDVGEASLRSDISCSNWIKGHRRGMLLCFPVMISCHDEAASADTTALADAAAAATGCFMGGDGDDDDDADRAGLPDL